MKSLEDYTKQNFTIPYECIGEIVDNIDPLNRGRLKCTIENIIDKNTPVSDLPWCETKGILFDGNSNTVGVSSVPDIGTKVYISFLYHNPSFPIVTGYVRGNKDSSYLHSKQDLNNTIYSTRNSNKIGPELSPLNSSTVYPKNNVIETDTAVIEIDDSSNNKRISIQHKNGSYFEIRPDGTVQIKSNKDIYTIVKESVEEYIQKTYNQVVTEGRTIQTKSTTHIGNLIVTGDVIVGGNVLAKDCISGDISGNSHTHPGDSGGTTGGPQ